MQIHQNTQSRAKAMQHNDECTATNMLTSQQTQLAHARLCLFFCFALQIELCATLLSHYYITKKAILMVVLFSVRLSFQQLTSMHYITLLKQFIFTIIKRIVLVMDQLQ